MRDDPIYLEADARQKEAASPMATRMASANAGSGKTRVLVDRVSRILLTETKPDKILCLTYTKAAASEMQTRLFRTLGSWSILPEADLIKKLKRLLPEGADLPDLSLARTLFAEALETPEGLKVQTIHAFCERILSRFPIEAGILPGFEPIDDADKRRLQDDVRDDLYRAAEADPNGALNQALQVLTDAKADQTLDGLFKWMSNSPDKIRRWIEAGGVEPLAKIFNLDVDANAEDILRNAGLVTDFETVRALARELSNSSAKTNVSAGEIMLRACETTDSGAAFEIYASAFFTQAMSPRKSIVTKTAPASSQDYFARDGLEASRVIQAIDNVKAANTLAMTRALLTVATTYSEAFKKAKHIRRGLDFNDQILLVRDLLNNKIVSEWVRYKLDGGIEHILVDEAQDTSPEQWDIINSLSEAFVQDSPDRNTKTPRTMFAVGDEKQSIFSFQGAKPERFLDEIQRQVAEHKDGKQVSMNMSFRSAQDVLDVVDEVLYENKALQRMFEAEDYPPASDVTRHSAFREDRGRVDLWPVVPRPEKGEDKDPWDTTPVDAMGEADAREQLALYIAKVIKGWLDNGEPIYDRALSEELKKPTTRPINAGDILILVQSRNPFFDAVIRNLKSAEVPVAGADRLTLKDSIAVKDLLSLAKFVLLPSDDLSLAEVLKSPIMGYDEDALFAVAANRDGSLWDALKSRRPESYETLSQMIRYSRRFAPYEFFARVLDMTDGEGVSIQKKIFQRLSLEVKDAVDAFLARALAHQRRSYPSLQKFVLSFSQDDQQIKREMESGAGQVRVMTVHGAKGLEAPVVFLPDTTTTRRFKSSVINVEDGFVFAQSDAETPSKIIEYKDKAKKRDMEEYLRLLYVAMTRAESRLIICGAQVGNTKDLAHKESWYAEVETAFRGLETQILDTDFGDGQTFGAPPEPAQEIAVSDHASAQKLPGFLFRPAPSDPTPSRRVTPSHLLAGSHAADMPVRSPLTDAPADRFLRGNLIHKLLEILPDIPTARRRETARAMLRSYKEIDTKAIIAEVFSVLEHPDFADLFAPGSRAEISLAGTAKGLPKHLHLNAQIDRICVTDTDVFIVDYKSNRPPPQTQDGVADIYWGQMAAYRALAREIYPGRHVSCALLWTDGPRLMILDEKRLDQALTQIAALPT